MAPRVIEFDPEGALINRGRPLNDIDRVESGSDRRVDPIVAIYFSVTRFGASLLYVLKMQNINQRHGSAFWAGLAQGVVVRNALSVCTTLFLVSSTATLVYLCASKRPAATYIEFLIIYVHYRIIYLSIYMYRIRQLYTSLNF